ncbi:hypothetical protein [Sneathiella sp.]|uniref:hypothetical protein n=1 Tax=Sneathiella sp. TaxID=1964365 RepID=UPI0039E67596
MVSVLLNFLVPVTHGFLFSAQAGMLVEMCTPSGIQLVRVDAGEGVENFEADNSDCRACADCPFYSLNLLKAAILSNNTQIAFDFRNGISLAVLSQKISDKAPPWMRPAQRAPPVTLI